MGMVTAGIGYSQCFKCLWPSVPLPGPSLDLHLAVEVRVDAITHRVDSPEEQNMSVSERGVEERCGLGDDEVQAVEVLLTELVLRHRLGLAYLGDGRRSFRLSATKSQVGDRGHRTWSNSTNVDSRHVDGSDAVVLGDRRRDAESRVARDVDGRCAGM